MSQAVIPVAVLPLGPQFQRLPNELLLNIFKLIVKLFPNSKTGPVIDKKLFDIMMNFGPLACLRNVCKAFSTLAIQAFYEASEFSFAPKSPLFSFNEWRNSLPAQVPWAGARHFLRRVTIHLQMEDSFKALTPEEATKPLHAREWHVQPITSVDQLLKYCPGTVQLLHLTNAISGFSCLHRLDLCIWTVIRSYNIGRWLDVLAELGIVVRAREVAMDIRALAPESRQFQLWHPLLRQAITVEKVVTACGI